MSIYEKLLNIQNELKAPKSQYNSFGKYNYRNCEDILEAVKPLCKKHGAVLVLGDAIKYIEGRYYVEANAFLYDIEDGSSMNTIAYAREEEEKKGMDGSQVTGAASSYARKYALNALFNIDDTKDSDSTNIGDTEKPVTKPQAEKKTDAPKQEPSHKPSMTLEQAKALTFKNGKNAGVPFEELTENTLKWAVDSLNGGYQEGASLVLAWKQKQKDEQIDFDEMMTVDDGDLPF